ncbi:hypothetical protein F9L33_14900 [Amylibacter sp. SFDW26]|uniref:hypothetical protein n=1 Tax=Amylibacter sp. SFDW26 TaxID=2652722 RepID=UPI0012614448|nr:hypothetical protein [Amylibacter sp. SFDW26]KAB7610179.1 hypothetical protein F9L33_14900 [Amylibacter sp. SFDW26]
MTEVVRRTGSTGRYSRDRPWTRWSLGEDAFQAMLTGQALGTVCSCEIDESRHARSGAILEAI